MSKKPMIISFSGGRTSAYMTYALTHTHTHTLADYDVHILFANTGCEHPNTLKFVHQCEQYFGWNVVWLECKVNHGERKSSGYKIVDYATASIHGEPYADMVAKYGMPNIASPHCTRELKLAPIRAWCKDQFGISVVDTCIGIRADETRRINPKTAEKQKLHYPLAEWGIDKQDVLDFWSEQPFDLEIPEWLGNCTWCFKKSDTKLAKSLADYPQGFDFPKHIEIIHPVDKYGNKTAIFRKHRTVADIEKMLEVTGIPPEQMITEGGCSESCEVLAAFEDE